MFTERLNIVMSTLGARSPDLARIIGCDRSNIDRMVKGGRVPKKKGKSVWRIAEALYLFADDHDEAEKLISCYGGENAGTPEQIELELIDWLYEGEVEAPVKAKPRKDPHSYRSFGERFDAVMQLAELSNVRLGNLLNVDASYISRFRKGFASPAANAGLRDKTCDVLLRRLAVQEKLPLLAGLMGIPPRELPEEDSAFLLFRNWLFDMERRDASWVLVDMIEQIDSFQGEIAKPPLSFEQAADRAVLEEADSVYYGESGLQRAVIRFLGNVIRRKEKELFLYSDQSMDWMVGDPLFQAKWMTLMMLCVEGGTKIHIIHNIGRDLSEMADAIRSWAPLYPSGMIHSYCFRTPGKARFSTTLFLCPGYACIAGANVIGAEKDTGLYRYDTDPVQLKAHEDAYRELLLRCGELVHAYNTVEPGRMWEEDIGPLAVIENALSLATMPEDILKNALARSGASPETAERLLAVRKARFDAWERKAKSGALHEYIPIPDDEDVFAGRVPMDLPGLSAAYTAEEYAEHIRNIILLSENYPGCRIYLLPEAPFQDIKLLISDTAAAIVRQKAPYITIQTENPEMCHAYVSFAGQLQTQYKQDRLSTKRMLERFL